MWLLRQKSTAIRLNISVLWLKNLWPLDSGSNWNLEMRRGYWGKGKTGVLKGKPLRARTESTTNSTHVRNQVQDLNPAHIRGRWVLSPLHHPRSPAKFLVTSLLKLGLLHDGCKLTFTTRCCLTWIANIAWDLDDCAFMFVLAVVRERAPCCKQLRVWKKVKKLF